MTETFRPLTISEQFFDQPITVNVPYSVLPENLPEVSTAPVDAIPSPDLSGNQFHSPSFLTKAGQFIGKNWWLILGVIFVGGGLYYLHQKNKKSSDKSTGN